jgi:hypothetical protein
MADVEAILRRHNDAVAKRGNWDSLCQEIAERIWPQMADFTTTQRADGEKRTEQMYDATGALALTKFAAAIESFSTPRNMRWNRLTVNDKALGKSQSVKAYLDEVNDLLYQVRYSPRAAFANQTHEVYLSYGAFGSGVMLIEDDIQRQALRYKSVGMNGVCFMEDEHGQIDTLFRLYRQTLRQLARKYTPEALPDKLRSRLEKYPDEAVDVLHYIAPREEYMPGRFGALSMPWQSCVVLPEFKHELREAGYESKPFVVARYMTAPNEVMGRSPGWLALSNIKTLNQQKMTHLKVGHKLADPPLLAYDDGVLQPYNQTPGAVNYGGLDAQGNQLVKPLISGGRLDITLEMMDKEREIINDAFLVTLFQILVETPNMTATEVMERAQEKATLLAPVIGRIQSEFLGPLIDRELQIMASAGQLPEMPPELIEAQGEYEIQYTSPMAKAMRASEGVAIMRTLETAVGLAQIKPDILDTFDVDEAMRELADINGMPAKLVREPEAVAGMKEARVSEQQQQQMLEAAPALSQTAANLQKLQSSFGRSA